MASYSHGRGKQSYREFSRDLNEGVRDIKNAIRDGEDLTANDVSRFLTQLTQEYIEYLKANGLDVELWGDRAIDSAYAAGEKIITDFGLTESEIFDDEGFDPEVVEEIDANDTEGDGSLLGYPLVSEDNKQEVRASSIPRQRFFTNLDELSEYVTRVPYVTYLQILHNTNGQVLGYRVWVQADKQKRKSKSA